MHHRFTDSYSFLNSDIFRVFQHKMWVWLKTYRSLQNPTMPTYTPFFSTLELLRLFLSCCTIGLSSFPAFSLCLLVLRLRPVGGTAWSRLTLGGRVFPSSLYRCSISLLWNAWSSEISFMCLVKNKTKNRTCLYIITWWEQHKMRYVLKEHKNIDQCCHKAVLAETD